MAHSLSLRKWQALYPKEGFFCLSFFPWRHKSILSKVTAIYGNLLFLWFLVSFGSTVHVTRSHFSSSLTVFSPSLSLAVKLNKFHFITKSLAIIYFISSFESKICFNTSDKGWGVTLLPEQLLLSERKRGEMSREKRSLLHDFNKIVTCPVAVLIKWSWESTWDPITWGNGYFYALALKTLQKCWVHNSLFF